MMNCIKMPFAIVLACLATLLIASCGGEKRAKTDSMEESVQVEKAIYAGPLFGISDENNQYWFLDTLGNVVIGPYDHADGFSEGLSRVWKRMRGADKPGEWEWDRDWSEGKWGYIDQNGRYVIEPQFDDAGDFHDGLAKVRIGGKSNGKWGYIDRGGIFVIQPQYFDVHDFSEGKASVREKIAEGEYKDYIIDKSGKVLFDEMSDVYVYDFHEGMSRARVDYRWGFIDTKNKMVIAPQFYDAYDFSEGLAKVSIGHRDSAFCGYIDKAGNYVIEPQYERAGAFHEGLAYVSIDGKCGYIDKTGKIVIKPIYYDAGDFSEGLASVYVGGAQYEGGELGYIDRSGNLVINPQYCWGNDFHNGLAKVGLGDDYKDGKCGYINRKGMLVWQGFEWID